MTNRTRSVPETDSSTHPVKPDLATSPISPPGASRSTLATPAALWLRVSTDDQHPENQLPELEHFAGHHGYAVVKRYELQASAWNGGQETGRGARAYLAAIEKALADAHRGGFKVLVIWALDRLTRQGAEQLLRLLRRFKEAGVVVVSVHESWLGTAGDAQDVLVAFYGWMAQQESRRRSERVRAGLARRKAEGRPLGRQVGATDKKPRKRSGYVARWEDDAERARQSERMKATHVRETGEAS